MILKRLYDYAHDSADAMMPPGAEAIEIEYIIVIDKEGKFLRFESKRVDKKNVIKFVVKKRVGRTSKPKPNTLWDNGKYVFGFTEKDKAAHGLFVEKVREIAANNPEDESVRAWVKFYSRPGGEVLEAFSEDPLFAEIQGNLAANFSARLEGDKEIIAEKQQLYLCGESEEEKGAVMGRCLVTGERGPLIRLATATPIPGCSPVASLVSCQTNSGYDSYGKTQAYNAPISQDADSYISAAVKKLSNKNSRNKVNIGARQFLFWGTGKSEADTLMEEGLSWFLGFQESKKDDPDAKSDKVVKLFKSIFSGEIKTTLDDTFCILGLSPNKGRISVVFWSETLLREFAGKIMEHFEDMDIIDTRKKGAKDSYKGVYAMISTVTRGGKVSDSTPNLMEATVDAVFNGKPYPYPLYTSALERIRAELCDYGVNTGRAAILKAYLNRKTNNENQQKIDKMLDKTNTNPGYLSGRLTAVLEKIQRDVNSGDTIRTRYMGSASATPAAVMPAMLNVSLHHSEKLTPGRRIFYDQLKQEIMDKLPVNGFPAHLSLDDQGRFFIGYYQQMADFFKKSDDEN